MIALVLAPLVAAAAPPATTCATPQTSLTSQHAPVRAQKLGELPDAEMDLAVIRSVDGCWVRQVVRVKVSQPGAPIAPLPTPGFTGTLVPDGSVAKTTPTGR